MGITTNPSIIVQPHKRQDLTGKHFGKLTVLEYDPEMQKWKCQCSCGNLTYKNTGYLNAGTATSCGCKQKQNLIGKRFGKLVVRYFKTTIYYFTGYRCPGRHSERWKVSGANHLPKATVLPWQIFPIGRCHRDPAKGRGPGGGIC